MTKLHGYLVDIKPLPLRDGEGWTTHFAIYLDLENSIDLIKKVEMGNIAVTREEAYRIGTIEVEREIRNL